MSRPKKRAQKRDCKLCKGAGIIATQTLKGSIVCPVCGGRDKRVGMQFRRRKG